jgi:hypothetical protein
MKDDGVDAKTKADDAADRLDFPAAEWPESFEVEGTNKHGQAVAYIPADPTRSVLSHDNDQTTPGRLAMVTTVVSEGGTHKAKFLPPHMTLLANSHRSINPFAFLSLLLDREWRGFPMGGEWRYLDIWVDGDGKPCGCFLVVGFFWIYCSCWALIWLLGIFHISPHNPHKKAENGTKMEINIVADGRMVTTSQHAIESQERIQAFARVVLANDIDFGARI